MTTTLPNRLVTDLGQALTITPDLASRVAGTLLGAIAFSAPRELSDRLRRAVPDHDRLIDQSAPPLGGRTGEMRAMVLDLKNEAGAASLRAQLTVLGLDHEQAARAVDTLTRYLQDSVGIQAVEQLLTELPALKAVAG